MRAQLRTQALGGALPTHAGTFGAPLVAVEAPLVQAGDRHQAAQAGCLAGICRFVGACEGLCFWAGDDAKGRG